MQLIGFNLTKILAERFPTFKRGPINTNIEFKDVEKTKVDLFKDKEVLNISFLFSIIYSDPEKKEELKLGEVSFHGSVILSPDEEEMKEITKSWKKNEIPDKYKFPLINYILRKCSTKALIIEEDLNIPPHMPFPMVKKEEKA